MESRVGIIRQGRLIGVVACNSFLAHSINMEPWSSAMATPPGMACTRSYFTLVSVARVVLDPLTTSAPLVMEPSTGCWFSTWLGEAFPEEACVGGASGLQLDPSSSGFVPSMVGDVIDKLLCSWWFGMAPLMMGVRGGGFLIKCEKGGKGGGGDGVDG